MFQMALVLYLLRMRESSVTPQPPQQAVRLATQTKNVRM